MKINGRNEWLNPANSAGTNGLEERQKRAQSCSALIAKIPFPLAQHIARCFR